MCFALSGTTALASTNGNARSENTNKTNNTESTNSKKNVEGKREEVIDPKLDASASTEDSNMEESAPANDGAIFLGEKPDTTNMNSVSKFNFIFYFIYKLKYDEDPNGIGHMSYEF